MAPSESGGSHEEDPIHRGADGHDSPRSRSAAGPGGGQEARRELADHLCLAEALRQLGTDGYQAPPAARAGERPAEEDGGRSGPGDRRPQGDHAKKMVAHACAGSRSRMHARAGCQAAGRAPCSSSPGRHSATNRVWWPGMPCRWPPCVGWRRSIRATDIAGFESS